MTEEQKKKYMDLGACICPYCESQNIVAGTIIYDEVLNCITKCDECGRKWRDFYSVSDVEEIC